MNSVVFVGICREISKSGIVLESQDGKMFQFFFLENEENSNLVEIGELTKIEGYLDKLSFPFPVVVVEKVYQIKKNIC